MCLRFCVSVFLCFFLPFFSPFLPSFFSLFLPSFYFSLSLLLCLFDFLFCVGLFNIFLCSYVSLFLSFSVCLFLCFCFFVCTEVYVQSGSGSSILSGFCTGLAKYLRLYSSSAIFLGTRFRILAELHQVLRYAINQSSFYWFFWVTQMIVEFTIKQYSF